jgi:D-alanyl-D-alanine carboxypeptidase (penicillin-binding protein 5/6)
MEQLELPNTKIHAQVFRGKTSIAPERSKQFGLGSTTAGEMVRLLELLNTQKLITPAACDAMLEHLRHCDDKNRIRRFLPANIKVAHKTGSVTAVRTAAGIIEVPGAPIAICVLTSENKDQRWTDENAAEKLIADIAREAYQHFQPRPVAKTDDAPPEPAVQILRVGAQGELVQALQRTLNARSQPSPELSADGDFGAATKEAVIAFQRSNNLTSTGEVSPETWQALGPLVWKGTPVPDPEQFNAQQLNVAPPESLDGPPLVTCKAWAIADGKTGEVLWGDHADTSLDIASTTKMMTAYIVAQLAAADAKVLDEEIVFSEAADKTGGSTSDLQAGERISVRELLYGLLLPSGNDASIALAEHFGPRLEQAAGDSTAEATTPVEQFVAEMNRQAAQLGMDKTHYANPHGLTAKGHRSTARDLLKLARAVLDDSLLAKYVSTRQHAARVVGEGGYVRNVAWKNTNQLLPIEGYLGVKTGTTDAAGACLVSASERDGERLLMVVLGSSSSTGRYVDARNLYRWAWRERAPESPR